MIAQDVRLFLLLALGVAASCGGHAPASTVGRDQLFVASAESGRVEVFDASTLRRVQALDARSPVAELASSNDGARVFGTLPDADRLLVIRRSSPAIDRFLDLPAGPRRLAASPDGKLLWVSCERAAALAAVDLAALQVHRPVPVPAGAHALALVPGASSHEVYASNADDDTVSIVDGVSRSESRRLPLDAGTRPAWILHAPADASVWTGSRRGELLGINAGVRPQALATRIKLGSPPGRFALNPANEQHLWILLPELDRLVIVDAVTRAVFPGGQALLTDVSPQRLVFGRDGHAALLTHETRPILAAFDSDPASPGFLTRLGTATLGQGADRRIALNPDRKRAWVTSPDDRLVEIFDSDPASPTFLQRLGRIFLQERPGPILVVGPGGSIPSD